jgi:hypothetical protein
MITAIDVRTHAVIKSSLDPTALAQSVPATAAAKLKVGSCSACD